MQAFANKLLNKLNNDLLVIEQENDNLIKRSELSFNACRSVIGELKLFILKYKYKSEIEEIKFFKEIKPQFTSRQTFHLMVYNIETKRPNGGKEILKKYIIKELDKLKHYFDYNIDFYKYYRAGATYLDHKYFIRDKFDIQLTLDGHIFENDTRFSTAHDFKIAKILAHDLLQIYLEKELDNLENRDSSEQLIRFNKILVWTDSKVFLVELIYALYTVGAFNRGTLELKELAESLSQMFNIDINDIYRTWSEIKLRKEPTKYLDHLKDSLLEKIKEDLK